MKDPPGGGRVGDWTMSSILVPQGTIQCTKHNDATMVRYQSVVIKAFSQYWLRIFHVENKDSYGENEMTMMMVEYGHMTGLSAQGIICS